MKTADINNEESSIDSRGKPGIKIIKESTPPKLGGGHDLNEFTIRPKILAETMSPWFMFYVVSFISTTKVCKPIYNMPMMW